MIVHMGSKDGWAKNAGKVWICKKGNADYHEDMDSDNFNKWADQAFKELPPNSVIVMVCFPYFHDNHLPNT